MPPPAEGMIQAGEHSQAVHVTCIWPLAQSCCAGIPHDLLTYYFFPSRNPITSTTAAEVSSHGGLVVHVTPHTSRGFRCSTPSGFLLSSLPTLFSNEKEIPSFQETSGASVGAVQVGVSPHHCSPLP